MDFKANSGYTLIEIILAIAILGLVLVPILTFMTNSSGIITHADVREKALLVAQQRMEYLKSQGFESLSDTDGFESVSTSSDYYPQFDTNKYPITNIEEKIEENTNGIKDIIIRITWDDRTTLLKSKLAYR